MSMTRTLNPIEALFAELSLEFAALDLTKGLKKGSVKHDAEVTSTMEELASDYYPSCAVFVDFGNES